jgi:hypothetical protein
VILDELYAWHVASIHTISTELALHAVIQQQASTDTATKNECAGAILLDTTQLLNSTDVLATSSAVQRYL